MLLLQRECGGWPKNVDMIRKLGDRDRAALRRDRRKTDAMFDNGATYTHMAFLARVHACYHEPISLEDDWDVEYHGEILSREKLHPLQPHRAWEAWLKERDYYGSPMSHQVL